MCGGTQQFAYDLTEVWCTSLSPKKDQAIRYHQGTHFIIRTLDFNCFQFSFMHGYQEKVDSLFANEHISRLFSIHKIFVKQAFQGSHKALNMRVLFLHQRSANLAYPSYIGASLKPITSIIAVIVP